MSSFPGEKKKGPGPAPRLPTEVLIWRRGDLISFLGAHWPELRRIWERAASPGELRMALSAYTNQPYSTPGADQLRNSSQELWDLIHSGRFKGNLLHLANAIAGVPEYAWRTSENILAQEPFTGSLGIRYIRDHLARRFPERFRELADASDSEEQVAVLMRTRSEDEEVQFLLHHPEKITEILESGLPRSPGKAVFDKHTEALAIAERLVGG